MNKAEQAANAINNLAVAWGHRMEALPKSTWDCDSVDKIYKLSLLPEEGKDNA